MRFQVPQFIEVEDKIFGPLTVSQFVYLAGGIGFFIALWILLPLWVAILFGGPVALLGLTLAFYKVNDRPFIDVMQSAIEFQMRDRLYIWDKKRSSKLKEAEQTSYQKGSEDMRLHKRCGQVYLPNSFLLE